MANAVRGLLEHGAGSSSADGQDRRASAAESAARRSGAADRADCRQQLGQRGQDRPVGPRQPRGLDLALEHSHLMAQDQDLRVLGALGAGEQGEPAEHSEHSKVGES